MRSQAQNLEGKKKHFFCQFMSQTLKTIYSAIMWIIFLSLTEGIILERTRVKKLLNILQLGSVITAIIFLLRKNFLKSTLKPVTALQELLINVTIEE